MDTWPVSLQQLLSTDNFSYKPGNTTIRSDVDAGPSKKRSRYTDGVDQITCSVLLDLDDIPVFKLFYKTTLNNGTNQFLFNDPFTGVATAFRFFDDPSIVPLGGRTYRLTMNWERMP